MAQIGPIKNVLLFNCPETNSGSRVLARAATSGRPEDSSREDFLRRYWRFEDQCAPAVRILRLCGDLWEVGAPITRAYCDMINTEGC